MTLFAEKDGMNYAQVIVRPGASFSAREVMLAAGIKDQDAMLQFLENCRPDRCLRPFPSESSARRAMQEEVIRSLQMTFDEMIDGCVMHRRR